MAHTETGTKYSGLYYNNYVSNESAYSLSIPRITTLSNSFVSVYGGDLDAIGNDGFVWSCWMDVHIRGPAANKTG